MTRFFLCSWWCSSTGHWCHRIVNPKLYQVCVCVCVCVCVSVCVCPKKDMVYGGNFLTRKTSTFDKFYPMFKTKLKSSQFAWHSQETMQLQKQNCFSNSQWIGLWEPVSFTKALIICRAGVCKWQWRSSWTKSASIFQKYEKKEKKTTTTVLIKKHQKNPNNCADDIRPLMILGRCWKQARNKKSNSCCSNQKENKLQKQPIPLSTVLLILNKVYIDLKIKTNRVDETRPLPREQVRNTESNSCCCPNKKASKPMNAHSKFITVVCPTFVNEITMWNIIYHIALVKTLCVHWGQGQGPTIEVKDKGQTG